MDKGDGTFEMVEAEGEKSLKEKMELLESRFPKHGGWFTVGEVVILRGSRFRVKAVKPTELRLKLLPKE